MDKRLGLALRATSFKLTKHNLVSPRRLKIANKIPTKKLIFVGRKESERTGGKKDENFRGKRASVGEDRDRFGGAQSPYLPYSYSCGQKKSLLSHITFSCVLFISL